MTKKEKKIQNMSDFIIYLNIFGEFDNFENCCGRVSLVTLLDNACRRELVH